MSLSQLSAVSPIQMDEPLHPLIEIKSELYDYSVLLQSLGLTYKSIHPYLQVGEIKKVQGWILHLSVVRSQLNELLALLIPFLKKHDVAFKIPGNYNLANYVLSGDFGYQQVGKIVSIYPETDNQAKILAELLIKLTVGYRGPSIPTDIQLGSIVFTRYGGFNPILQVGTNGEVERYIYTAKGKLILDSSPIPFQYPSGISWPFRRIAKPISIKPPKILRRKFILLFTLKSDVKGSVKKAIQIQRLFKMDWCIIKEGKYEMWSDKEGRSICDRIQWQYDVQKALQGVLPVPKVIELFRIKGDIYFVMEFIEGTKLTDIIFRMLDCNSWFNVNAVDRIYLLRYMLKIAEMTEIMHRNGIINRDLNSENFLIKEDGKIYLIDLELAYSTHLKSPLPPFALGTSGFMSPEQQSMLTPTEMEDIYGLGALMIVFVTGIHPTKFTGLDEAMVRERLLYFTRNTYLSTLIASCVRHNSYERPAIGQILIQLERQAAVILEDGENPDNSSLIKGYDYAKLVNTALCSFFDGTLNGSAHLWLSKAKDNSQLVGNEITEQTSYPGWGEGVAGVLFMVSAAKKTVENAHVFNHVIFENFKYVKSIILENKGLLQGGLYYQGSGLAFALGHLLEAWPVLETGENIDLIRAALLSKPEGLDLARGMAGYGLALLQCRKYLDQRLLAELHRCAQFLLESQDKDGGWILPQVRGRGKGVKYLGLPNGAAGILYFLTEYYHLYPENSGWEATIKGLDWLAVQVVRKNTHCFWPISAYSKEVYPWLAGGYSGIILTMIKGYERTNKNLYRELAEAALSNFQEHLVHNNLSFDLGICGIGEVYLEACRVFKTDQFLERVGWIAGVLANTHIPVPTGASVWFANETTFPTADFLTGNAGILHFLIRYLNQKIKFPLSL